MVNIIFEDVAKFFLSKKFGRIWEEDRVLVLQKIPGLGMVGEVASICDRSEREARTARPACLGMMFGKSGRGFLLRRVAGNLPIVLLAF